VKTTWTKKRLQEIFARYNRKFWRGRLPSYEIVVAELPNILGCCDSRRRLITISIGHHKSDSEIRGTVLHEMAHAAADTKGSRGHDLIFFAELEKLLRMGSDIAIDTPEAGKVRILANLVPSRFPLLKRKIDRAEARRCFALKQFVAKHKLPMRSIAENDILCEFEDVAMELTWKQAVRVVGVENGIVDETGRPLTSRSKRLLERAKRRFTQARRDSLENTQYLQEFSKTEE